MGAKIRRHPRKVHKILWKRVSLGRTGCRHSQNADHLHREKGSEMSTRATGQKDEAGREVGGVGMGRVEHLPTAQVVHHDAGEESRHLRQQGGTGLRRAAALSSLTRNASSRHHTCTQHQRGERCHVPALQKQPVDPHIFRNFEMSTNQNRRRDLLNMCKAQTRVF